MERRDKLWYKVNKDERKSSVRGDHMERDEKHGKQKNKRNMKSRKKNKRERENTEE